MANQAIAQIEIDGNGNITSVKGWDKNTGKFEPVTPVQNPPAGHPLVNPVVTGVFFKGDCVFVNGKWWCW